jgi:hypothetical protein
MGSAFQHGLQAVGLLSVSKRRSKQSNSLDMPKARSKFIQPKAVAAAIMRRLKACCGWVGMLSVLLSVYVLTQALALFNYRLLRRDLQPQAARWTPARASSTKNLHVSIIHNNETQRLAHLRPHVASMSDNLGPNWRVTKNEFFDQPPVKAHTFAKAYVRKAMNWLLGRRWALHRRMPEDRAIWSLRFLANDVRRVREWRRTGAIETILTAKHIAVWQAFLNSDGDYLIVMESDAVFSPDSEQRMQQCLAIIPTPDQMLYMDLAGGCGRDELRIDKIISCECNGFTYFEVPATNTSCVYLMSRATVRSFCATLQRFPYFRWIGIDWMVNAIMMDHVKRGRSILCIHANPPIFKHGSVTGEYDGTFGIGFLSAIAG